MSVVEKGLALAEVVVVGIAKVVWTIVAALFQATDEEKRNRKSFSELVDEAVVNADETARANRAAFDDTMTMRAMLGDSTARYHPAYRSREAG